MASLELPGMPNAHSHAFQRAMAGLTEKRTASHDSFWTWRDTMYRFAGAITPDEMRAIAAQAYVEMLEAGYTSVAEFHYVHHGGAMAEAVIDAAGEAGIALTLLPVLYMASGFGGQPPRDDQQRFVCTVEELLERIEDLRDRTRVGLALHSLRAVSPDALAEAAAGFADGPIHIHIAEQVQEVDDCLAWSGQRPVDWLLDRAPVDKRWTLVHATHLSPAEAGRLAASGAVVALCPTTEANLGDGLFPLDGYSGAIAIGSDSQITIDPFEELRLLEYGQRLTERRRSIAGASPGAELWRRALDGGRQSVGHEDGVVIVDAEHPALIARQGDDLLDSLVFNSSARQAIDRVIVGGRTLVEDGRHVRRDAVAAAYRGALRSLLERAA